MAKTFAGKVVVVTGANSGIGEAAVVAFAEAGAKVYGIARRQDALDAAQKRHPQAEWRLGDVANATEIQRVIESVAKEAGRLDVLVNNAGVFALAPLEGSTEEIVTAQLGINIGGVIHASRAALTALVATKGSILNLSSAAGHKAIPGGAVYAASKAAVESLTRSWALELAPRGVRVNAIAPGPTETPVFGKVPGMPAEALKDAFTKQVPLGRMAEASEISRWILAISEPGSSFITGQVWSVDGGMSL